MTWNPIIAETGIPIITFCQTGDGEVLIVSYSGEIYQLVRNPLRNQPSRFPTLLSETGLFSDLGTLEPEAGVYSYEVAAESYRGNVTRQYHVAIPGIDSIRVARQRRGWRYPSGTVFVRTFSKPNPQGSADSAIRIETQLLHFDGLAWQPYSYLWEPSQRDARLLPAEGGEFSLDVHGLAGENWFVHSRSQCRSCHTNQTGGVVGFSLENLSADAVRRFVQLKVLDRSAPNGWGLRKMVSPSDQNAELSSRARSFLTANCAHCHLRGGGGSVPLELEYSHADEAINAINTDPTQGRFDMNGAKVIAPGDPYRSVLLFRLASTGMGRMPKLTTHDSDPNGIRLIHDWIQSMSPNAGIQKNDSKSSAALRKLIETLADDDSAEGVRLANQAKHDGNMIVEALFERFLPANQRRKLLGPNVVSSEILAMAGDPSRGRRWLTESNTNQCLACHRVEGQGRNVGPALDGIGTKRKPSELFDSIVNPSAVIDTKYQSLAVLTDAGSIITGLKITDDQSGITVRGADGKDVLVKRNRIDAVRKQPQSLMPTGLHETMTARELADLIAYLSSLK